MFSFAFPPRALSLPPSLSLAPFLPMGSQLGIAAHSIPMPCTLIDIHCSQGSVLFFIYFFYVSKTLVLTC